MRMFIPGAGGKGPHIRAFQAVPGVREVAISDIYPWAYGNFVADRAFRLPLFADEAFLPAVRQLLEREAFDVCVPIHDGALAFFSEHRDAFADLPVRMAMNEAETVALCADKARTHQLFARLGLPDPELQTFAEFVDQPGLELPVFVKQRFIDMRGTRRQFFLRLEDGNDLAYARRKLEGVEDAYVVQPFLTGTEYNIDFFCDDGGEVLSIAPLKRLGMGASRGITRGEIVADTRFDEAVRTIARAVPFWGANQLQAYVDEEERVRYTEINARFSGSSIFVRAAGVDYFTAFVRLLRGEPIDLPHRPRPLSMSAREEPFFYDESPIQDV